MDLVPLLSMCPRWFRPITWWYWRWIGRFFLEWQVLLCIFFNNSMTQAQLPLLHSETLVTPKYLMHFKVAVCDCDGLNEVCLIQSAAKDPWTVSSSRTIQKRIPDWYWRTRTAKITLSRARLTWIRGCYGSILRLLSEYSTEKCLATPPLESSEEHSCVDLTSLSRLGNRCRLKWKILTASYRRERWDIHFLRCWHPLWLVSLLNVIQWFWTNIPHRE